jgi:hypothetical protein
MPSPSGPIPGVRVRAPPDPCPGHGSRPPVGGTTHVLAPVGSVLPAVAPDGGPEVQGGHRCCRRYEELSAEAPAMTPSNTPPLADEARPAPVAVSRPPEGPAPRRRFIKPSTLAYLMGPAALVGPAPAHAVPRRGPGAGVAVGGGVHPDPTREPGRRPPLRIPTGSSHPAHAGGLPGRSGDRGHLPVAGGVRSSRGAYAFLALENVATAGPGCGEITALWSLVGIAAGQAGHLVRLWRHRSCRWRRPTRWPSWVPSSSSSSSAWPGRPWSRRRRPRHRRVSARTASGRSSRTRRTPPWSWTSDGMCTFVSPAITELLSGGTWTS